MNDRRRMAVAIIVLMLAAACASENPAPDAEEPIGPEEDELEDADLADDTDQRFPDVIDAELAKTGDGEYQITVTISSAYDSPERYADGWRVLDPDGEVLAEHDLAHHHANEQPFSRTRGPFAILDGVDEVTVEGRDLEHGYGGQTVTTDVPR